MSALSLTASRRRDQVVILNAIRYDSQCAPRFNIRMADVLRLCGRVISWPFTANGTLAAIYAVCMMMWWHNLSIDGTLDAQRAVAIDALCLTPWAVAWTIRFFSWANREGGEA